MPMAGEKPAQHKAIILRLKTAAVQSPSRVRLFVTPWTAAHQAPLSVGFSRHEYWMGHPPELGIEPVSAALEGIFFTTEPPVGSTVGAVSLSNSGAWHLDAHLP